MKNRAVLYGYKVENGITVIVDAEAEIIKEIFNRYIAGETFQQIADDFTSRCVVYDEERTTWSKSRISRLMLNERYCGGESYPAIISKETFDRAMSKRAEKSPTTPELSDKTIFLKKAVFCGECGHPYRRIGKWRSREKWLCSNGCKCMEYVDDRFIDTHISKLATMVLGSDAPVQQKKTYTPTPEVQRMSNDINRMANQPELNFTDIAGKILQCASIKFDCCHIDKSQSLGEVIRNEIRQANGDGPLGTETLKNTVKRISIFADGSVSMMLKDGEEFRLQNRGEHNDGNIQKNSDKD